MFYLKHNDIDYSLWDRTIAASRNSLPYAYTWYLDVVSPGWEALVSDIGYTYVMPLPVKKKWGVKYLIHPRWTQQLGIFSPREIEKETVVKFLKNIPYLSYAFNVNEANKCDAEERPNAVINLEKDYETIRGGFSKNTIRNIELATRYGLCVKAIGVRQMSEFWSSENRDKPKELHRLLPILADEAVKHSGAELYGVFCGESLIASLMLLTTADRLIYLVPASSGEGRDKRAMFLLVNEIIKYNAGKKMILDFEGSRIDGVARFYDGFGSVNRPYWAVKRCRPEFLVKLLHG